MKIYFYISLINWLCYVHFIKILLLCIREVLGSNLFTLTG
jgi:hypothetical protein